MTSNTLCSVLGSSEMVPWTLSDDTTLVFLLPDDTAIYARMGESVSVPPGTYLSICTSMTYNNMAVTGYPLAAVGVKVTVEAGAYYINRHAETDADASTRVSCPQVTGASLQVLPITQSCTLTPALFFEDTQGTRIQIGNSYPTTRVTVTAAGTPTPAAIPLQITAMDFIDQYENCIKWVSPGTPYRAIIYVKNDTTTTFSTPINVTVNGVRKNVSGSWTPGMSHVFVTDLVSTGNDTLCATFTESNPTNGILDWINSHPIETLAVAAVGILGISYFATRDMLNTTYKRTKK